MTVIKLRPDREDMIKDALEAHMSRSSDFILISIGEAGVEVGSTLDGRARRCSILNWLKH
jgi:hypothetical protein